MSDKDVDLYQRIARIEERLIQLDKVAEAASRLEADLSRYRGMVGGILLILTALVTFFKLFGGSIKAFLFPDA